MNQDYYWSTQINIDWWRNRYRLFLNYLPVLAQLILAESIQVTIFYATNNEICCVLFILYILINYKSFINCNLLLFYDNSIFIVVKSYCNSYIFLNLYCLCISFQSYMNINNRTTYSYSVLYPMNEEFALVILLCQYS